MRKVILGIVITLIVALAGILGYLGILYVKTQEPVNPSDETVMNYTLQPGTSTKGVNRELAELGLIEHPEMANLIVKLNDWSHIQAGEYELSPSMTLEQMYQKFESGDVVEPNTTKVVIPEGYDLEYIAASLALIVDLSAEDILNEWKNIDYLKQLVNEYWFLTDDILKEGIRYPLEGYFYPATYSFLDQVYTLDEVTHLILDVTAKKLEPVKSWFDEASLNIHQVFSLASVIEGETQNVEEMPIVAGVFFNRINSGMYLQSDMTVLYALDEHNERVTEAMTKVQSPYNTYVTPGIPIGPVSSPSIEAIKAVLHPDENNYYYFIADMYGCVDGKTHFFETYEEHMKFYRNYLLPSYEAGTNVCQ